MQATVYVGVDVSKDTFEAVYSQEDNKWHTATFDTPPRGVKKFIDTLAAERHQVVLEATGYYSLLLCHLLSIAQIPFSLLNPRQSAAFARMQGATVKTDKRDAILLAQLGAKMQPPVSTIKSAQWYELKQKRSLLRTYKKQRTALMNFKSSLLPSPYLNAEVLKSIDRQLAVIEQEIAALQQDNNFSDETFKELFDHITTIKGIGKATATDDFDNAKAFAKFIGICPTYRQSGTSVKCLGHINRSGNPSLRACLYMAARVAKRYKLACKATYERLRKRGKSYKQAIVAVMNQLLRQIFTIVKKGATFEKGYNLLKKLQASDS
jgi:transposase